MADRIRGLVGDYPVDVKGFRTEQKDKLHADILEMTRKHFEVIRHFVTSEEWDYFHFVEIGLDRMHHGFWKHHDPRHVQHDPASPYRNVIRDYYRLLDHEIGTVLELLDADTLVLVVSDHGARALDGGFCVNEWLVREGYLVLRSYPEEITPFERLDVDWSRTKAWSSGGYYARIFLNVRGREPEGAIEPTDYFAVRTELVDRLEEHHRPRGTSPGHPGVPSGGDLRPCRGRSRRTSSCTSGISPGAPLEAWDTDACTSRRTTPGPTTATMPSSERSCWRVRASPSWGSARGHTSWTSPPRFWSWRVTTCRPACRGACWCGPTPRRRSAWSSPTADDALVRERLKGLGYLG